MRSLKERNNICAILERQIRHFQNFANIFGGIVELINSERESHSLITAEHIHKHGHIIAANIFKQQSDIATISEFRNTVGNFSNFEFRRYRNFNTLEQIFIFEFFYKFAQIIISHKIISTTEKRLLQEQPPSKIFSTAKTFSYRHVAMQVVKAQKCLTAVFGKGTGRTTPPYSPKQRRFSEKRTGKSQKQEKQTTD